MPSGIYKRTDEHNKNISKSLKGVLKSDSHKAAISKARTGITMSDEAKANMSISAKTKPPMTDETKLKMSKSKKGHLVSDTIRTKISKKLKGVLLSKEHIKKLKNTWKNRGPVSDETKAKMRAAQKANPQTGDDIVNHHYIYDDSDPSKYTIGMTRSDHTRLHRLLQRLGYIVPHINIKEDN